MTTSSVIFTAFAVIVASIMCFILSLPSVRNSPKRHYRWLVILGLGIGAGACVKMNFLNTLIYFTCVFGFSALLGYNVIPFLVKKYMFKTPGKMEKK